MYYLTLSSLFMSLLVFIETIGVVLFMKIYLCMIICRTINKSISIRYVYDIMDVLLADIIYTIVNLV